MGLPTWLADIVQSVTSEHQNSVLLLPSLTVFCTKRCHSLAGRKHFLYHSIADMNVLLQFRPHGAPAMVQMLAMPNECGRSQATRRMRGQSILCSGFQSNNILDFCYVCPDALTTKISKMQNFSDLAV